MSRMWFRLLLPFAALVLLGFVLPGWTQTERGKKHALVVGVRGYDSSKLRTLKYTENDAEKLAEVLEKRGGFSVRVLTTSRGQKRKADAPTVDNLRAAIAALLADRKRDDTVLVALSGHGIQSKVKDRDESFFCPCDAQLNDNRKLLALGQLFRDLDDCGAGVKLLLVDACRNDPKEGRNVEIDTLPRLPNGTGALFSCSSGERAFETDKLGGGHGVFFYHVIQGLQGEARDNGGEVTWARLSEYVTRAVADKVPVLIGDGARQTPELKVNLRGRSPVLIGANSLVILKESKKEIRNSIGMKLVRIPAGRFLMGSTRKERDDALADYEKTTGKRASDTIRAWYRAEGPLHQVEITRAFYMGVHEVTQQQFKAVMGYNPSYFSSDGEGLEDVTYTWKPAGGKDTVSGKDTADFPVENVSNDEAVEFCNRLTALAAEKEAGRAYRLPREAEWEYACRGGASPSRLFHFGDSLSSRQANFNGRYPYGGAGRGISLGRTRKVAQHTKNAFGLHDMHGNVWEWCSDWFDTDYYRKSPRRDPQGPAEGSSRVFRGGSWDDIGQNCRSAHRNADAPSFRSHSLGFRVVGVPSEDR
jgi:formylglycine-generating enzyme required for sulfatase activity